MFRLSKLSKWIVFAILTTFVLTIAGACKGDDDKATPTAVPTSVADQPLAAISIFPDIIYVSSTGLQQFQQFAATGRDKNGNLVAISPVWSIQSGGGVIDSSGFFTAGITPGSYTNTVRATFGNISGTATVVVSAAPLTAPLASITVLPNPINLQISGIQQFVAAGKDVDGKFVAVSPTWSIQSGAGSISALGLFSSGNAAGSSTVKATSGNISGTANVTVSQLASITIASVSTDVNINTPKQFIATGKDGNGNSVVIAPVWSVVAGGGTIDSSGLFTAGATPGTYTNTVRATFGNVSSTATVVVSPGPLATQLTSISILPSPINMQVGRTQQFVATGRDRNGNIVLISPVWSIQSGVGSISGSGFFSSGNAAGSSTVKATFGSISGTATITVAAAPLAAPLASISVLPNPINLQVGVTQQFAAAGQDTNGKLIAISPVWSIQSGVGSISGSGLFSAGDTNGTSIIKVTSGNISGTATVTVRGGLGVLTSITIAPNLIFISTNSSQQSQQFVATGRDVSGNLVTVSPVWSIQPGAGTALEMSRLAQSGLPEPWTLEVGGVVDSSGLFIAGKSPGTYSNMVKATFGNVSGTANVIVSAAPLVAPLASIGVFPNPISLQLGGVQQFVAAGTDVDGKLVAISPTWSIEAGVGSITSSGLFNAGTVNGTGTVKATFGNVTGIATVIVSQLASITVAPNPADIEVGDTRQFIATGKDREGNTILISPVWSVVAGGGTITKSGLFTAGQANGTFNNTVKATSGSISGTATLIIGAPVAQVPPLPTSTPVPGATPTATPVPGATPTATPVPGATPTATPVPLGPAPVVLGLAGSYAILSSSGISSVPTSNIVGDIGTSPITGAAITGLGCPEVTGTIYTVNAAGPACRVVDPSRLTTSVSNALTAYENARDRTLPDFINLHAGLLGGKVLVPGLYKYTTDVLISTDVTLSGGPNDVWIFQITGDLTIANGKKVLLSPGVQAKNIFWQVGGLAGAEIGTTAHFEGNILTEKAIHLRTGASINGRLLAQTAVTLESSTVIKPTP